MDVAFVIEVIGPDPELVAAFSSSVEAYRYAALMIEPAREPHFRRRSDGAVLSFADCRGVAALVAWVNGDQPSKKLRR